MCKIQINTCNIQKKIALNTKILQLYNIMNNTLC